MSRILFLDIDGVLNSHDFWRRRVKGGRSWAGEIDPEAVARLNRITARGVDIVVSSTWRLAHKRTKLCDILSSRGFKGRVAGITPSLPGDCGRGAEIALWLARTDLPLHSYAIVDDDHDAGIGHDGRFVRTDIAHGLTDADVDRLLAILGVDGASVPGSEAR